MNISLQVLIFGKRSIPTKNIDLEELIYRKNVNINRAKLSMEHWEEVTTLSR